MPRRNQTAQRRRSHPKTVPPQTDRANLSGRVPHHIEQMARELVKRGVCPPEILGTAFVPRGDEG